MNAISEDNDLDNKIKQGYSGKLVTIFFGRKQSIGSNTNNLETSKVVIYN